MLEHLDGSRMILFGDDMADVERYLTATPRRWPHNQSVVYDGGSKWDMSLGWEGACRMAREGWSEGARNLAHELDALPAPTNRHADERHDVAGWFPSVPRYVAGLPDHMVTRGKRVGSPPVVHLVLDMRISAAVNAQEQANFGLAMAAMVDKLEASGRRVELDVVFSSSANNYKWTVGWKVKSARDHLDLSAVAFSLGHPAAFRRIGFALYERTRREAQSSVYGYGGTLTKEELNLINAEGAFLIEGINHNPSACRDRKGALRFAAERINAAAGEELVSVEA